MIEAPSAAYAYKFNPKDNDQEPNMVPNLKGLRHMIDVMRELGLLNAKFDVSKCTDPSDAKEATAQVTK